jgi:DNA-binding transcriptional LysR family regulator
MQNGFGERRATGTNFDLKLLTVIGELHRTRSVSQAAERLAVSQSAISMSLAKLRKHFNDPLFVRTSTGMEPTPHALELIGLLSQAQSLLQTAFGRSVVFDPRTSERVFRVQAVDIAQITFLPRLMRRLRKTAPSVGIDLQPISPAVGRLLESGELDLAVGFLPDMGAGFCQQRLFQDRFVCAVRSDHPRIGPSRLTVPAFEAERHIAVAGSRACRKIIEKTLETKKIHRRIALTVPSFLGIASLISTSDCIVMLPEQLGKHLAGIKLLELPFEVPVYDVAQHWHERYSQDPANRWLRAAIAELFPVS